MKILISGDTYYPDVNGCSYFTQRLAYNLKAHGHDVRVIAPSQSFDYTDNVINTLQVYGIRSFPILFYTKFRFCLPFVGKSTIQKIVDDFQPDIVHIQAHFAINRMIVRAARTRNIPIVATNHFMPENLVHYIPLSSIIGPPIKKLAWKDFTRIFNKVGQITTPTATAAALIQPYFKKPIQAISCGINLKMFNPGNNGTYLKERYKLKALPILLYVGRLDKEKNLDMAIKAFAMGIKNVPFQFVIAGNGAEKKNLIELSQSLGVGDNVIFAGFVPNEDLPNLYAIADCFIIAGTAELQSIVTMEAMASGLPVLGVNAMALPELVRDGKNGMLFEYGDVDGLAKKMTALFSNTTMRKEMGKKSLELIASHEIGKSISKFEEVYRNEISHH